MREPRVVRHAFLDETEQQGCVVAGEVVVAGAVEPLRRVVRGLVLPGQRRLHRKAERHIRRRQIVAALVQAALEVVVDDAGRRYHTDLQARGVPARCGRRRRPLGGVDPAGAGAG